MVKNKKNAPMGAKDFIDYKKNKIATKSWGVYPQMDVMMKNHPVTGDNYIVRAGFTISDEDLS